VVVRRVRVGRRAAVRPARAVVRAPAPHARADRRAATTIDRRRRRRPSGGPGRSPPDAARARPGIATPSAPRSRTARPSSGSTRAPSATRPRRRPVGRRPRRPPAGHRGRWIPRSRPSWPTPSAGVGPTAWPTGSPRHPRRSTGSASTRPAGSLQPS
jgi:hypothetical protein